MKGFKNSQTISSFTALVATIAVGTLAATGWLVFQHNRTIVAEAVSANPPAQQTAATIQQGPSVAYLHVKEWHIRLPLPASLKDAYYVPGVSSVGLDGTPNQIYLGLKSLDGYGCTADGSNHGRDSAIAMIFRANLSDTDPVSGKPYSQIFHGVTLGTYFYGYENATAPDSRTCKAPQQSMESADAAFASAEKSIAAETASAN